MGDQEFIDIRPEGARHALDDVAVCIARGPLGMVGARHDIPHAGVVDVEPDAALARDLAPRAERVVDDARRCPADLRRIAGPARMALAVVLHVVGLNAVEQLADVVLAGLRAEFGVGLPRVEVEVDAEERVLAGDGADRITLGHGESSPSG